MESGRGDDDASTFDLEFKTDKSRQAEMARGTRESASVAVAALGQKPSEEETTEGFVLDVIDEDTGTVTQPQESPDEEPPPTNADPLVSHRPSISESERVRRLNPDHIDDGMVDLIVGWFCAVFIISLTAGVIIWLLVSKRS